VTWALNICHGDGVSLNVEAGLLSVAMRRSGGTLVRYRLKFPAVASLGPTTTKGRMLTVHRPTA
jgi:hypothetical protein